jgi:hypothetical protein
MKTYRVIISIALGLITLCSCKKKVYDHCVIEITYPDSSKEMISFSIDNAAVLTATNFEYGIRASKFFENSVDIDLTKVTCISDSANAVYNLLKIDGKSEHLILNQVTHPDMMDAGYSLELVSVGEVNQGGVKTSCYSNLGCCNATCNSMICCAGDEQCPTTKCSCTTPAECPSRADIPSAMDYASLFSKSKINQKVPWNKP